VSGTVYTSGHQTEMPFVWHFWRLSLALAAEIFIKLVQAMESYYFGFSTSRP